MTERLKKFKSVREVKAAVKAEAKKMGMTIDEFVRIKNIEKSKVLRAVLQFFAEKCSELESKQSKRKN